MEPAKVENNPMEWVLYCISKKETSLMEKSIWVVAQIIECR